MQRDGFASLALSFSLSTLSPLESILSIAVRNPPRDILSSETFSDPLYNSDTNSWTFSANFSFQGTVGVAGFAIEATTGNPSFLYIAESQVTVSGIQVAIGQHVVSGAFRKGIGLGSYAEWIGRRQLALPLRIQPPSNSEGLLPVNRGLKLQLIEIGGVVDSVLYDRAFCSGKEALKAVPERENSRGNTLFVYDKNDYSISDVSMLNECGLGISGDGRWLILRFESYRVSGYNFRVRIDWKAPNSAELDLMGMPFFPSHTVTNFVFDERPAPPVIVLGENVATLDHYGNEVLTLSIANALQPLQTSDLRAKDFTLEFEARNNDRRSVSATRFASAATAGEAGAVSELSFRTPTWSNQSAQDLRVTLTYMTHIGSGDINTGSLFTASLKQTQVRRLAVIAPGSTLSVSLVSPEIAQPDECEQDPAKYEANRFTLVELESSTYNATTFSTYKKREIAMRLRTPFPRLSEDGVRLVSVEGSVLRFGILVTRSNDEDELKDSVDALERIISSQNVSVAVNLESGALKLTRIETVNMSLCEAFKVVPPMAESVNTISGIGLPLLALWVVICIVAVSVLFACLWLILLPSSKSESGLQSGRTDAGRTSESSNSGQIEGMEEERLRSRETSPSAEAELIPTPEIEFSFRVPFGDGVDLGGTELIDELDVYSSEEHGVAMEVGSDLDSSTENAMLQGVMQVVSGLAERMSGARRWFGRREGNEVGQGEERTESREEGWDGRVFVEKTVG